MDEKGDNDFAIEVALVDDSIIVTMPGTRRQASGMCLVCSPDPYLF
jgi:hypothetical protein